MLPVSLTGAHCRALCTRNALNRLTSSPLGSYTYGDPTHLHAATAAGNMYCRAPTNATTCAGTPTGASLTYNNVNRLVGWQNAPSNPTSTDSFAYDGEGNRTAQNTNGTKMYYFAALMS